MVIAQNSNEWINQVGISEKDFHIIECDGNHFLLHVPTLRLFEIDDLARERIEIELKKSAVYEKRFFERYGRKNIREVEKELRTLVEDGKKTSQKKKREIRVKTISLNVAQSCNLRCLYCYAGDGSYGSSKQFMDDSTAFKIIDFFVDKLKSGNNFHIHFFGGEPLLNFRLIEKVVDYAKEKGKAKKIAFRYSVVTNGTLFENKIVRFLKDNRFGVTVSIDGPLKFHDRYRIYTDGEGSFKDVIRGLDLIRSSGGIKNLACRVTVCDNDLDFVKTFRWLKGKGFEKIHFTPKSGQGTDWEVMLFGLGKIFRLALKDLKRKPSNLGSFSNFTYLLERLYNSEKACYPCGAGRSYVGIDVNGSFYLCHRFTNRSEFKMGSVNEELNRRVKILSVDEDSICCNCWARYLCGGGCHWENFIKTGCVNRQDKDFCRFSKNLINWAIILYIKSKRRKILGKVFGKYDRPYI